MKETTQRESPMTKPSLWMATPATLNHHPRIRVRAWIAELPLHLLLTYFQGRGCGVGRSLDGGVPLGVGVGRGVVVGVAVGGGKSVGVGDGLGGGVVVAVAVAVGVGDGAPPTAAKISTRPQP